MSGSKKIRAQDRLLRQCDSCSSPFKPHPRLGSRQKTCGKDLCQKKHRAGYRRQYRNENPQIEREYELKRRDARLPSFWKIYRQKHPIYEARNRAQSRLRKKLVRAGLQRQLDIVQLVDPPGKLDTVVAFATSHRSLLNECRHKTAA